MLKFSRVASRVENVTSQADITTIVRAVVHILDFASQAGVDVEQLLSRREEIKAEGREWTDGDVHQFAAQARDAIDALGE